jgi:hypothetical protein
LFWHCGLLAVQAIRRDLPRLDGLCASLHGREGTGEREN